MNDFEVITLDNGIRCVHCRVERSVAYMSLTIGVGTRDELPDQHGVAHLVEHLMFKGTARRSSYKINNLLESVGGELNAFTSKEDTVLHATCPIDCVAKGADLLADMAFNSTFDADEIDKEREVIIDEINSYKDAPSELIFDDFEELLFDGSALGRNILGSKRNLKRVSRGDLVNFCATNYVSSNVVFTLSSSLSHKRFEAICRKVFGGVAAQKSWVTARQTPSKVAVFDVERNKRSHQTHTIIGGYAPSAYASERLTTALLLNIVGGQSAMSRMNLLLREKHALTYNAEAAYSPFTDSGLFTLYFSCESHKTALAERLLRKEINRFATTQLSDNEIKRYKKQMIGQMLISSDNMESAMISVAKGLLLYDKCEVMERMCERINEIQASDIQGVAQQLFAPVNLYRLCYV